jgi:Xaa-Pro aminopeptidase
MTSAPDDVLELLRRRCRQPDPSALDALMRGVAAAPESLAGPEWVELIDPQADAELTKALTAWRAELAQADDGLDAAPAPASRLAALRAELNRRGLAGFVVPRADEHQGEYVPRRSQRLAWLTGFSGSAGLAIVLADRAAIFIDGRYTLAVRGQVDSDAFVPHQVPEQSPETWIAENLTEGGKLGFDPWLQTVDGHERFARACQRAGGEFMPVDSNPVHAWVRAPPAPLAPVLCPDEFGESSGQAPRIAGAVMVKGATALITAPDRSPTLNVRGGDVPRTPFAWLRVAARRRPCRPSWIAARCPTTLGRQRCDPKISRTRAPLDMLRVSAC